MNDYLNILINKSQADQQEKLQQLVEKPIENKKNLTQNNFVRKMKIYRKKRRNEPDHIIHS